MLNIHFELIHLWTISIVIDVTFPEFKYSWCIYNKKKLEISLKIQQIQWFIRDIEKLNKKMSTNRKMW